MKNKKGFTLIELIGAFAVLAVVLGIVSIALLNVNEQIKKTYYKTLEESLVISGSEYFNYNKDKQPQIFGSEATIEIGILENNKYVEDEVIGKSGKPCNKIESYVGAYKDSYDKTNYYACLTCDDYKTDTPACNGEATFALGVKAKIKDTNKVYLMDGKTWANNNIILTFTTLNNIQQVVVENTNGNEIGRCNITNTDGIGSCSLEVDTKGIYNYYGVNENNKTTTKQVNLLIDKTGPEFSLAEEGINNIITKSTTSTNLDISNTVIDIKDLESGIKEIKYSLEEKNTSYNYQLVNNTLTEFDFSKNLTIGKYTLNVEVTNNANLKTIKEYEYVIFKPVSIPDSSFCNDLTYNSLEQTLTKSPLEGYDFINTKQTKAGNHQVTARLKENYGWANGDIGDKTITCEIKKANLTITSKNQTITYGQSIIKNTSQVTTSGLQGSDNLTNITLEESTTNAITNGKITPKNAVIKNGTDDRSNCYNITYQTGSLVINKALATAGTCNSLTYTGSSQTLVSGGSNVSYSTNSGTNAGNYDVTVTTTNSNYAFSDGTTSTTLSCSIARKRSATTGSCKSSLTYNGSNQTLVNSGSYVTYSRETATTPGSYNITVYANDNYAFSNGSTTSSLTCSIGKGVATAGTCNSLTYNGSSQTLVSGGSNVSYSTNSGTNAGSYNVTVSANDNYQFSNGSTSTTLNCSIARKRSATTGSCKSGLTYTGSSQTLVNSGSYVSYSRTTGTNATSYSITAYADDNYAFSNGSTTSSLTCSIGKGVATAGTCNSLTYTGSSQTLISGGSNVSYSTNSGTNAGSYNVTVSANDNYQFSNGSTSTTLNCSIARKRSATTGSCKSGLTYNGYSQTLVNSGSYVSYSQTTGTNAGSYPITASANANYAFSDGSTTSSLSCSIAKANLSGITTSMSNYTYGGTLPSPSISSNPSGGSITYYYGSGSRWSGMTSTTLNPGTYSMYAVIGSTTNYNSYTTPSTSFTVSGNVSIDNFLTNTGTAYGIGYQNDGSLVAACNYNGPTSGYTLTLQVTRNGSTVKSGNFDSMQSVSTSSKGVYTIKMRCTDNATGTTTGISTYTQYIYANECTNYTISGTYACYQTSNQSMDQVATNFCSNAPCYDNATCASHCGSYGFAYQNCSRTCSSYGWTYN